MAAESEKGVEGIVVDEDAVGGEVNDLVASKRLPDALFGGGVAGEEGDFVAAGGFGDRGGFAEGAGEGGKGGPAVSAGHRLGVGHEEETGSRGLERARRRRQREHGGGRNIADDVVFDEVAAARVADRSEGKAIQRTMGDDSEMPCGGLGQTGSDGLDEKTMKRGNG